MTAEGKSDRAEYAAALCHSAANALEGRTPRWGWQTRLAAALGVSRRDVSGWLSGARPVPERWRVEMERLVQLSRENE